MCWKSGFAQKGNMDSVSFLTVYVQTAGVTTLNQDNEIIIFERFFWEQK